MKAGKGGGNMPNKDMLIKKMKEMRITQGDLAKACNIATSSMCLKINGRRPFYLDEAEIVSKLLDLRTGEFGVYFFRNLVAQCNQK